MSPVNKNPNNKNLRYCLLLKDPWQPRRVAKVKVGDIPYIKHQNNGPREDIIDCMNRSRNKIRLFESLDGIRVFTKALFLDEYVDDLLRRTEKDFVPKLSVLDTKTGEILPFPYDEPSITFVPNHNAILTKWKLEGSKRKARRRNRR